MPVGGWCPAGRAAEHGPIDLRYPLRETPSADPAQRTEWNVRDSDGTLLLVTSARSRGMALTRDLALRMGRPMFEARLDAASDSCAFLGWLAILKIRTLNVAGPRESESPGAYAAACAWLHAALS